MDYTKGPWDEIGFGHDMQVVIVNHQKDISTPIKRADYSLLKAAPDMYEALKALVSDTSDWWCPACKRIVDGHEVTSNEYHENCGTYLGDINNEEWLNKARKSLAKAEGKTPDSGFSESEAK